MTGKLDNLILKLGGTQRGVGGAAYCEIDFRNYASALFRPTSLVTSVILVSLCFTSSVFLPERAVLLFLIKTLREEERKWEENFASYQLLHIF